MSRCPSIKTHPYTLKGAYKHTLTLCKIDNDTLVLELQPWQPIFL